LLLFPSGDAESLLGRTVQRTKDGSWTIADRRAPGCDVRVRRREAKYKVKRRVDVSHMTSLSAGFAKLVDLQARYGASDKVDIEIENTAVLHADIRGECGEVIVDKVFVGRGKRKLVRSREAGGGAHATIQGITPGVEHVEKAILGDSIEWKHDQAYGFTYKKLETTEPLSLLVRMSGHITEGDQIDFRFETNKAAWLVVYYLDQQGKGAVLWPSPEEPEPQATAGKPAVLPSVAERLAGITIEARLAQPGVPARETLIVYAFSEKADYDQTKPSVGAASDRGGWLAANLTQKVERLPLSRWTRAKIHYVIKPKP